MYCETTDLIEHQKLDTIIDNYVQAQTDIKAGVDLLAGAKKRLAAIFGDQYDDIAPNRDTLHYAVSSDSARDCAKHVRKNAWRYLIQQLQLDAFMSDKAKTHLYKQIDEDMLPEITHENVLGTFQSFIENADILFQDAVKEVFNFLRPWRENYKTNKHFFVGPKVIKEYAVEIRSWGGNINYRSEQNFRALDNVFHRLDGKGTPKYPGDFLTAIKTAMHEKKRETVTDYFRAKWYLNGNMHIEFRRLDLLKRLNEMGGDHEHVPGPEHNTRGGSR
jgi:hypothetical protein